MSLTRSVETSRSTPLVQFTTVVLLLSCQPEPQFWWTQQGAELLSDTDPTSLKNTCPSLHVPVSCYAASLIFSVPFVDLRNWSSATLLVASSARCSHMPLRDALMEREPLLKTSSASKPSDTIVQRDGNHPDESLVSEFVLQRFINYEGKLCVAAVSFCFFVTGLNSTDVGASDCVSAIFTH